MIPDPRLVDCFLYTDQSPYRELLELRLNYLADVVDGFVIVHSRQTFSGKRNGGKFPWSASEIRDHRDRITLVDLDTLDGETPRAREYYARRQIRQGLTGLKDDDLVMVSDIDEVPRRDVLTLVRQEGLKDRTVILGLEYFNFKFNYKLVHGLQVLWAGPTISRLDALGDVQAQRDARWIRLADNPNLIHRAGWHFSFLTDSGDVAEKLTSMFKAGEPEWRGFPDGVRGDRPGSVQALLSGGRGFHDHMYAGSVWAKVPLSDLGCPSVESLIAAQPQFVLPEPYDCPAQTSREVELAMWRLYEEEMPLVLQHASARMLLAEQLKRLMMPVKRSWRRLRNEKR